MKVGWRAAPLALLSCIAVGRGAEEETTPRGDPFEKDEVDRAIERAIGFLIGLQGEDGSIDDGSKGRKKGSEPASNSTAMTSLAIMAIASVGHQTGDPTPQGEALRKALDCILDERRQSKDGYFGARDGSRMYGHGITALMLGEMLGMGLDDEQDKRIRQRLAPAIEVILRSQKRQKNDQRYRGGWRYLPDAGDADLSVTVWQVMALRSAKNAGMAIPKDAIDEAAAYIRRSYESYREGEPVKPARPYSYEPGGTGVYSTASAGLLALQVCGFYDDATVKGAADWLLKEKPKWGSSWFFYGTYYYAQGMFQRGGAHAEEARRNVRQILLSHQAGDGSWRGENQEQGHGRVYATTLGILSLSVKCHYLPIYQR